MKISGVIKCLQNRLEKHGDIEVKVTWEGIIRELFFDRIYKSKFGSLYIDADFNQYKEDFSEDINEGLDGE